MFNFGKKKKLELYAPITGKAVALENVPDPVFAQKMMGEGIAFEPQTNIYVAPADGKITMIAPTKHAFGLTLNDGTEILVHIGMDTVNLNGEGFEVLVKQDASVKKGTPIIKADLELFRSKGIPTITPLIVLNKTDIEIVTSVIGESVTPDTLVITQKG
ncbi:PTS glucose transporter subunit IIA [Erysipelothrix larvae]|uniref:PTS glucose transporter subunit IIA n=1 Tax=Erysipelothrix larvae TaxID=1514105 RepID=A0A120JTY2_9FIRM|nr:PTS glucose transporter subunit IIA [Erysipelothrix larvae]AMC94320.1 PTS glucose transporter subunit IIA [Erysipelothrix larvae]